MLPIWEAFQKSIYLFGHGQTFSRWVCFSHLIISFYVSPFLLLVRLQPSQALRTDSLIVPVVLFSGLIKKAPWKRTNQQHVSSFTQPHAYHAWVYPFELARKVIRKKPGPWLTPGHAKCVSCFMPDPGRKCVCRKHLVSAANNCRTAIARWVEYFTGRTWPEQWARNSVCKRISILWQLAILLETNWIIGTMKRALKLSGSETRWQ